MPAPLSEARKRKGRPPLPAGEKRSSLLVVRLTDAEHDLLRERAKVWGVSVAYVIRSGLGLPTP